MSKSKMRSGNPARRAWQPMRRGILNPESPVGQKAARGEAHYPYRGSAKVIGAEAWGNDLYDGVLIRFDDGSAHFTFKRRDRAAVRDWRHIQAIKNEIAGPEREAVEVFPPETALVDAANEYHLWILPPGMECPVGLRPGGREMVRAHDSFDRQAQLRGVSQPGGRQRGWQPGLSTGPEFVRIDDIIEKLHESSPEFASTLARAFDREVPDAS